MGDKKRYYPEEIKQAVIQMKLSGEFSNREIMDRYQIKSRTQIKRWMKWFRDGEGHRLGQPIGRPYTHDEKEVEWSEVDELRKKVLYYELREELMGKYRELERKWNQE